MRRWLKRNPKKCGFETGSWQMDMVTEMIRKEFGVTVRARTLRRWLRRIGFSWRKDNKSKAVREYVESAGGDVELEFLLPYTPQLNPCRDRVEGPEEEACRQVLPVPRVLSYILEKLQGNTNNIRGGPVYSCIFRQNERIVLASTTHLF